jgi:putative NADH-flavin reductase
MRVALLGATGRTGVLVLDELLLRGHQVSALVRADGRVTPGEAVSTTVGDSRDRDTLAALLSDCQAVISAIGPRGREESLHRDTARALVAAMHGAGVRRFVGVSGMSVAVPGDERSGSNLVAAWLIRTLGRDLAQDKRAEWQVFASSDLEWTLARATRLVDGDETGRLEHSASRSTRSNRLVRADLATFLVDCVEHGWYGKQAPFVATARP